jgi:DNA-directed RNA polymerase III subunit RPC6
VAGADGIWNRTIRHKLQMQESMVKSALETLETQGLIAEMKSVEHPNKKMYIKADLRPSERATGGPWFAEGAFDSAFVAELERAVFEFVKTKSTYETTRSGTNASKMPRKGVIANGVAGQKRSAKEVSKARPAPSASQAPDTSASSREVKKVRLPLPAGFAEYPTVMDIAEFVNRNGMLKDAVALSNADVQQLMDVLVYDGLVEPIRVGSRKGFRVVRPTRQGFAQWPRQVPQEEPGGGIDLDKLVVGAEPMSNGLTEAPCGRCPVFEICEEGGPVNPSNCVYFERWLESCM